MSKTVADLCDNREHQIQVFGSTFDSYGGKTSIGGQVTTIKVDQNPKAVKAYLEQAGDNHILVVDADANPVGAVLGDNLATIAVENNWQAIIINGFIRDTVILKTLPIGIWALGTCPRRGTNFESEGQRETNLSFGCINISPGNYIYADEDGIIVSEVELD